VIIAFDKNKDI